MEKLYDSKENCCGCGACYSICPVSAISMIEDENGFKYPVINKELCINCKKCVSVCPLNKKVQKTTEQSVFALKNKEEKVRINSSSGGFFTEIAKEVIQNKGVVYGAVYDEQKRVIHQEINNIKDIEKLRGAKYVQSKVGETYKKIEKNLKENKKVLFSGTPCQVLGLIQYLGKEYSNLITCDLICHGVPSPKIFEEHKKFIEKKYKNKIKNINFRYKKNNHVNDINIEFEDNQNYINTCNKDNYYFLFLKDYILRESCYSCRFSNTDRISDITIGDFWGINKTIKDFDDGKGVSLVIINSKKGQEIYEKVKEKFYYRESNIKDCLQPNLQHSTIKPKETNVFWKTYHKKGYKRAASKMRKLFLVNRVKNKIKKLIK